MNVKTFLILLSASILLLSCMRNEVADKADSRPNILFIMSDDHAEKAISSYGGDLLQTPNIDRLAKEGMLFTNSFVTNSICAPSRAVMLTGKYSHKNGLRDNRDVFDGTQITWPKLLQEEGYQTSVIGKWHLKTKPEGFDYWNVLIGQGDYYNPRMVDNGDTIGIIGYTTDVITDIALEWLESRQTDKPFALLYHHKAPHRNWMPNITHLDMYKDDTIPLPATFYDDYMDRRAAAEQDMRIEDMFMTGDMKLFPEDIEGYDPGSGGGGEGFNSVRDWERMYGRLTQEQKAAWDAHYDPIREQFRNADLQGNELIEWKYQRYMKDYLRSVHSVDENIGRVLDYLDDAGLAENTIVIYTSDQGFYLGEHGWYDKRFMYEESLSMPLIIRYPSEIPAGQVSNDLVMNLDFAPTFLDYTETDRPADLQGESLREILSGRTPAQWRNTIYYHYYEYPHGWHSVKRHNGVRSQRYKLIHFYEDIDEWEFYDLQEDPNEVNNLINDPAYRDMIAEHKAELTRLQQHYEDNTAPDIREK